MLAPGTREQLRDQDREEGDREIKVSLLKEKVERTMMVKPRPELGRSNEREQYRFWVYRSPELSKPKVLKC